MGTILSPSSATEQSPSKHMQGLKQPQKAKRMIDDIQTKVVSKLSLLAKMSLVWLMVTSGTAAQAEQIYTFGVVPQFEARALAAIWLPILKELENQTDYKLKMVGSPRIPEFEEGFEAGEFDFAYMNPYHLLVGNEKQGYVPLVRDGARQLFGVLVVRKDSPIETVAELDGQVISFPAPNALGASLLMRADLDQIHNTTFDPIYVSTHTSSYLNVILGRAAAGGGVMGTFRKQNGEVKNQLRVLYETRRMPPHPVAAHPRVPPEAMASVQAAFLAMATTDEGAELLSKIPMRMAEAASLADYEVLGEWGLEDYFIQSGD